MGKHPSICSLTSVKPIQTKSNSSRSRWQDNGRSSNKLWMEGCRSLDVIGKELKCLEWLLRSTTPRSFFHSLLTWVQQNDLTIIHCIAVSDHKEVRKLHTWPTPILTLLRNKSGPTYSTKKVCRLSSVRVWSIGNINKSKPVIPPDIDELEIQWRQCLSRPRPHAASEF